MIATPDTIETLADLVERLGGIPLQRIRFRPPVGTATEQDVLREMEAPRKRLCELVEGVLVEKAMGYQESTLAVVLCNFLYTFVNSHNLGLVSGPDGTLKLQAGSIRIPDVAFISWARIPGRKMPQHPIPNLVPDLAVEVLSKSNTVKEMERKRLEYFNAGVRLVWEIDLERRVVCVYTAPNTFFDLSENDVLDGGEVLPGFTLPLRQLFAELDRHG